MGISNSIAAKKFNETSLENYEENTTFVRDSEDPCFGDIKILRRNRINSINQQHPEEQLIFYKTKLEPEKEDYTELYRECDARLTYKHPNLLDFLGFDFMCTKHVCGTQNKGKMFFQYYERDLEHELNKRAKKQNYYTEREAKYLLNSLVSVGSYLQEQSIYHGDLRPVNIFISPTGKVKIGDHILLNQFRNNYNKALLANDQQVFLSPELMQSLQNEDHEPVYDEFKSDVWSLGLTILEVLTLCPSLVCYDYDNSIISYTKIQELLTKASQRYSYDLISKIKLMLEEDQRARPDMIQLSQILNNPLNLQNNSPIKQSGVEVARQYNMATTNYQRFYKPQPQQQVCQVQINQQPVQYQPQQQGFIPQIQQQQQLLPQYEQQIQSPIKQQQQYQPQQDNMDNMQTIPKGQNQNINFNNPQQNNQNKDLYNKIYQALDQTKHTLDQNEQFNQNNNYQSQHQQQLQQDYNNHVPVDQY